MGSDQCRASLSCGSASWTEAPGRRSREDSNEATERSPRRWRPLGVRPRRPRHARRDAPRRDRRQGRSRPHGAQPQGQPAPGRGHGPRQRRWARANSSSSAPTTSPTSPACRRKSAPSTPTASAAPAWRRCTASPPPSPSAPSTAASPSASSAWAARSVAAAARGPKTRITEFNKRLAKLNKIQRDMAPEPRRELLRAVPGLHPRLQPDHRHDADGAERRRGLRPDARRDSTSSPSTATARSPRPTTRASTRTRSSPSRSSSRSSTTRATGSRRETGKTVVFEQDECLRRGTNMEGLGALNPVKGIVSLGGKEIIITAGNSCPTNDGVSAALLMSEDKARELGLAAARPHHRHGRRPA